MSSLLPQSQPTNERPPKSSSQPKSVKRTEKERQPLLRLLPKRSEGKSPAQTQPPPLEKQPEPPPPFIPPPSSYHTLQTPTPMQAAQSRAGAPPNQQPGVPLTMIPAPPYISPSLPAPPHSPGIFPYPAYQAPPPLGGLVPPARYNVHHLQQEIARLQKLHQEEKEKVELERVSKEKLETEVNKLKSQIQKWKETYKESSADANAKAAEKLKKANEKLSEAKKREQDLTEKLDDLKQASENKEQVWRDKVEALQSELETTRAKHNERVSKLSERMDHLKQGHQKTLAEHKKQAADKLAATKAKSREILQKQKAKLEARERKRKLLNETATSGRPRRQQRVEDVGNKQSAKWMSNFERLKQFNAEFGHFGVPRASMKNADGTKNEAMTRLFNYVQTQRTSYRKMKEGKPHSLTPSKIQLLNSIGFDWRLRPDTHTWDESFQKLLQFSQEHGHCDVPQYPQQAEYAHLGNWVLMQRRRYRLNNLDPEYQRKLEEVGFKWSLRDRGGTLAERMLRHHTAKENDEIQCMFEQQLK